MESLETVVVSGDTDVTGVATSHQGQDVSGCVEDDAATVSYPIIDFCRDAVVQAVCFPVQRKCALLQLRFELGVGHCQVILCRIRSPRDDAARKHIAVIAGKPAAHLADDGVFAGAARPHNEHDNARADQATSSRSEYTFAGTIDASNDGKIVHHADAHEVSAQADRDLTAIQQSGGACGMQADGV